MPVDTVPVDQQSLHVRSVVADTHNDLLMAVSARPPAMWASFFRERWLPQLVEGGVDVQVLPVFVESQFRPEGALRQTLRMIECAHALAEGSPDAVALCHDGQQIDEALALGRIALVLALESMPGIDESVELIPTLHRLGVRVASIAHWGRTALADGSGQDGTGSRLTSHGVEALREMERLGMLFDISHLGATGVAHVLEIATRPVIATHSSARVLRDHHRNLTDEQLRGVAAGGGVVCVNFLAAFLTEDARSATIDHLVDHIEHIAGVAGIDHVGLGPDFMREVNEDLTPPCCEGFSYSGIDSNAAVPGLEGPRGLPLVTDALVKRGFSEEEIQKILGANVMRLFRAELGRPAHDRPAHDSPAHDSPAHDRPAHDSPAHDRPAQDGASREVPADDRPVDDRPARERPEPERPRP